MLLTIFKKIPAEIWVLLLLAALGAQSYFLYQAHAESKALKASVNILEADMENDREANRLEFERQQEIIDSLQTRDLQLKADLDELERTKADINSKADEEKNDIRNIRDADSLRSVVTRRYTR